jgi:hypothetical protein
MFCSLRIWLLTFNLFDARFTDPNKRQIWVDMAISRIPDLKTYLAYLFSFVGLYSGPILPLNVFENLHLVEGTSAEIANDFLSGGLSLLFGLFHGILYQFDLIQFHFINF